MVLGAFLCAAMAVVGFMLADTVRAALADKPRDPDGCGDHCGCSADPTSCQMPCSACCVPMPCKQLPPPPTKSGG